MADGTPTDFNSEVAGKTLTKADFVEAIFTQVPGMRSRRDAADLVELLFESIKETLARGEPVKISGFGNFTVRAKPARMGRDPRKGEDIPIPARRVVTFKASQVLKDQLNQ